MNTARGKLKNEPVLRPGAPARPTRKFTLLHLVIALALGLSACSPVQPDVQGTPTGERPARETATGAPAPNEENLGGGDLEAEDAVITFGSYAYERSLYEPLIEAFNEQYAPLTVQFVELPEYTSASDVPTNYYRALASAADTTMVYASAPEFSYYFRDLQPLLESDPSFDVDDFWSGALDACVDAQGRMVGVPLNFMVNGIFYDRAAFEAAGLPLPAPGWTYDDLRRAVEALKRKDGDTVRYGLAEQGLGYNSILGPIIDAHLYDTDGEPDPDALLEEIQWYADLIEQEALFAWVDTENYDGQWQAWQELFEGDSRPAMWGGDLGGYLPGVNYIPPGTDPYANTALAQFDFAPYPVSADGSLMGTSPVWPTCIGISAGSRNPRGAWTWLNFLSRQSLVRDRTMIYEVSRIPARRSVADASGFWDSLPDKAEPAVRYAVEHAWFNPLYPVEFGAVVQALSRYLTGKAEFAEALDATMAQMASTPQPTPDTAPVVVATPRPTLSADTKVIDFFFNYYGSAVSRLKAEIEAYRKENPDVAINLEMDFGGQPSEDIHSYLASEYDCFIWFPSFSGEAAPSSLLDLTPFFQAEGPDFTGDFFSSQLEPLRSEGKLFGLPAANQPQVMAYNKTLLERLGLEIPGVDWTFDDFLSLIAAVGSTRAGQETYGFLTSEWEELLLRGRGVLGYDPLQDPPLAKFDSPEFLSGLEWLLEQKETNAILLQGDDNWQTVSDALNQGRVAFWSSQAGQETGMYSGVGTEFEIGALPMPEVEGIYTWTSNQSYFISAQADDPQACWDWIRHLLDQPDILDGMPTRRSLIESSNWRALVGPDKADAYQAAVARSEEQLVQTFTPVTWPLSEFQRMAVSRALKGEDLRLVGAETQQKAENYLACIAGLPEPADGSSEESYSQVNDCASQADPTGPWQP